jgi:hypothetical protein
MLFVKLEQIGRLHFVGHQKERHVADDFAGRRNFNNISEKLVHLSVHFLYFAPSMAQAHGSGLFAKICVLAAGNFVLIEARGTGFRAGIEGQVISTDGLPIVGAFVQRSDVEIRVPRSVPQRLDDRIQIGLAGSAAFRTEAELMPLVSCVWKWTGMAISARSVFTSS